ncbi:N-acetylmuramoyl-L-alanine amidase CwlD [Peribacillus deserti]|uniref:N-acetylmuramoyl-L-alanine amidase CwlD n=1 Tax=Peribacillus deserti TaxID=673318 RepID=A0A2N5MAI5_9BACI|nr:N-acetylmuramoyl-L-alanine amidase CwlD [Peribacillus deserti]PLT31364.1 N-acetylmuramoyl-L-alanine amidase CwlD [Peribacillus deserti]
MKKKWKYSGIAIGITLLFLLITFQIIDKDSWKPWSLPLSGKIIVIDPGHGGVDAGANNGPVLEKEIALSVSKKIRDYLQEQGALVLLTREEDKDLAKKNTKGLRARKREDLRERVEFINKSQADLYISLHLNAFPSTQWSGAQTFYTLRYDENKRAAKFIQEELKRNLENTSREAKAMNTVYLMKHVKKPGALVEIGFLSNPMERANLQSDIYQEKVAASIYKGISRYFTEEYIN